jgi:2'-5' RNA ligase
LSTDCPEPTELRNHWWWRPGWRVGRSFYTWHVTFADQPGVHQLAATYAPLLATLPLLDPIPFRWLHLTMQGLGFTDEVDPGDVAAIHEAAATRLAELEPCTVTLRPPRVNAEALYLPVQPVEPLRQVRATIRRAIREVWGEPNVPEATDGWQPHVSLAYANAPGPLQPVADALATYPAQTAEVEITTVSLIDLNRDNKDV